jgi:PAS domain S-box-containing protein
MRLPYHGENHFPGGTTMHDKPKRSAKALHAPGMLDALPAHIAELDRSGMILWGNRAWQRFAAQNGPYCVMPRCSVGVNYLEVCRSAVGPGSEGAAEAAAGIEAVLAGRLGHYAQEYPCHSPQQSRWFHMDVSPLSAPEGGAVVAHFDITQRKLSELAQQASESRLQLALDASGDGLWDWDLTTGTAYLSPSYYALTGYRPEEVTASYDFFRSLVHPEDWPSVEAAMQAHLRGETPDSVIEYRMLKRGGDMGWIMGRGRVVQRDGTGRPLRMMGLITDITDRKQAEMERMRLRARSETIMNSHTIGLVTVEQRIIREANQAMHTIFGYADGELIDQPTRLLFPDDESHARFGATLYPLLQAGKAYHGMQQQRRKDGSLGWYRFDISSVGANQGVSVAAIMDITQEKMLEDQLRESEARYRAVLEDQTEVISRVDSTGRFLYANEVFCRFFGKTMDELLGQPWMPAAHPDDLAMIEAQLAEPSPQNPIKVIENRVFAADGEMHWMQFINRAFFDADGRIKEIQSVGRDITQRKALEVRQAQLREEVTRLSHEMIVLQEKERSSLAQELHDDLSQELVAIRARASAVGHRQTGEPRTQEDVDAIEASARHIYAASHRIMKGLRPQLLDSAGLAEALRELLISWSAANPAVQVRLRLPKWLDTLSGEAHIQLFRIAQECLANVAGHARAQRVRVFLGKVGNTGKDRVRLVVRDDGIGLDTEARHVGLGLILMRERAHSLGGSFDLSSRPGHGTRLAVSVPI